MDKFGLLVYKRYVKKLRSMPKEYREYVHWNLRALEEAVREVDRELGKLAWPYTRKGLEELFKERIEYTPRVR